MRQMSSLRSESKVFQNTSIFALCSMLNRHLQIHLADRRTLEDAGLENVAVLVLHSLFVILQVHHIQEDNHERT